MLVKSVLSHILDNDALTRGLADPEARMLVEWLVEKAEQMADDALSEGVLSLEVKQLCLRARSISRFVALWCHQQDRGAAIQLAAAERFTWPLPRTRTPDPCELMLMILTREDEAAENG